MLKFAVDFNLRSSTDFIGFNMLFTLLRRYCRTGRICVNHSI